MHARVVVLVAALNVDIPRIQFPHDLAEHTQLEVLAVQQARGPTVRKNAPLPLLRNPDERQLREIGVAE